MQGPGGGTEEPCWEFVGEGKENTHFYIDPQALKDLPQFPLMENHRMKSQRNPNRDRQWRELPRQSNSHEGIMEDGTAAPSRVSAFLICQFHPSLGYYRLTFLASFQPFPAVIILSSKA